MATIFGNGLIRELPVGIVDNDNSQLSRTMIRNLDAVPELHVATVYANIGEAQSDVEAKKIYGYMHIPANTHNAIIDNKQYDKQYNWTMDKDTNQYHHDGYSTYHCSQWKISISCINHATESTYHHYCQDGNSAFIVFPNVT